MGNVNDIYQLQVRGTKGSQQIIHTLHFKSAVIGTDSAIQQDLIDSWQASSQVAWRNHFYDDYMLDDVFAQRVCGTLPLPSPSVEGVSSAGTRGTLGASAVCAPWLAMLSREATGFAGRSYAGRWFTPLPADSDVDGVTLSATVLALVDAYRTSLASYLSGGADADWDLFVYSRKLADVPGVECQNTGAVVVSTSRSSYLTSMRTRRSRTGA